VANEEISEAGRKARFERWERLGVDVIRTDLEATGGLRFVGGTPAVRELAWEWGRMKEAEQARSPQGPPNAEALPQFTAQPPAPSPPPPSHRPQVELVTLKPGMWGVSIDLKELGRRARNWWQGRKR
jgi:hypothetical protein